VLVTSGSEYFRNVYQTPYTMDIELPYNSKKLRSFTILITSFTHDLIIRVRQADKILLSESINLRSHYTTRGFAVVVDDKTSPDFLVALPKSLFAVNVRPRFLPETWYGYESVELLVMNAGMLNNLEDRQFQALVQWIKRGGYLVTTGGVNYGALLEKRIQHVLPLHLIGHQQVRELSSLETFCGQTLSSPDPFLILHATIEHAHILLQDHEIPILIEKHLGAGTILFVAFDFQTPPFSRWRERHKFWETILSLRPMLETPAVDIDHQYILSSLLSSMPVDFPNVKIAFSFLGSYLLLLKLFSNYLGKKKDRKLKSVGYLLLTILAFSLASYGLFFYPNTRKHLAYNSFCHINIAGQDQIAFGQYVIGLYPIKDTTYTVHFGPEAYPVTHLLLEQPEKKTPDQYVVYETNSGQHIQGSSEKWSHNFFTLNVKLEFPIVGQARFEAQDLHLMIDNMTPHSITGCWGYFDRQLFFLDEIIPGEKQVKTIAQSAMLTKNFLTEPETEQFVSNPGSHNASSLLNRMQQGLIQDILRTVDATYQDRQDVLYLLGWIESGIIPTSFSEPGIIGEDLTLITWEIPVSE
jgi:hypothetical protein